MAAAEVSSSIVSMRFFGEGAGVFDGLLADLAETWVHRGIVHIRGLASQNAARTEFGAVGRVLRIIRKFRFFLGIEVVEVAEEFIETVDSREGLIAVADMVLAELARSIAEVFRSAHPPRIELAHPHRCAGKADLRETSANAVLASQEGGPPCSARLFAIVMLKLSSLRALCGRCRASRSPSVRSR